MNKLRKVMAILFAVSVLFRLGTIIYSLFQPRESIGIIGGADIPSIKFILSSAFLSRYIESSRDLLIISIFAVLYVFRAFSKKCSEAIRTSAIVFYFLMLVVEISEFIGGLSMSYNALYESVGTPYAQLILTISTVLVGAAFILIGVSLFAKDKNQLSKQPENAEKAFVQEEN